MEEFCFCFRVRRCVRDLDPRSAFVHAFPQRLAHADGWVEHRIRVHADRLLNRFRLEHSQALEVELDSDVEGTGRILTFELEAAVEGVAVVTEGGAELFFKCSS